MTGEREEGRPVRPFSNGSEGYDWMAANCERCTKRGEPDEYGEGPCAMETAVSKGFILGTIPSDIATQIGGTVRGKYADMPRQCSEFAPSMFCQSIKTRNRRACGKPATTTVEANGLIRPVCARHHSAYLASLTPAEASVETLSPETHGEQQQ